MPINARYPTPTEWARIVQAALDELENGSTDSPALNLISLLTSPEAAITAPSATWDVTATVVTRMRGTIRVIAESSGAAQQAVRNRLLEIIESGQPTIDWVMGQPTDDAIGTASLSATEVVQEDES